MFLAEIIMGFNLFIFQIHPSCLVIRNHSGTTHSVPSKHCSQNTRNYLCKVGMINRVSCLRFSTSHFHLQHQHVSLWFFIWCWIFSEVGSRAMFTLKQQCLPPGMLLTRPHLPTLTLILQTWKHVNEATSGSLQVDAVKQIKISKAATEGCLEKLH